MGRTSLYVARRLGSFVPQVFAVVTVVFVVVRILPGNPAYLLAGPRASQAQVRAISASLGLNKPIIVQYWHYLVGLLHGNLGSSLLTSHTVASDLVQRLPATFELITCALVLSLLMAFILGVLSSLKKGGLLDRISNAYGTLAGALPDFWWGLMLALIFFGILHIAPAPIGRIGLTIPPPPRITGLYTIDSVLALDAQALESSLAHLALPVITLAFVYTGPTLKIIRTSMEEQLDSRYVRYARALGLRQRTVLFYAARNALLPTITMIGTVYAYLLSGDVLVEQVFSWGGVGQYAVQAVESSDYQALSGVVIVATVFALIVYLIVDVLYLVADPRVSY